MLIKVLVREFPDWQQYAVPQKRPRTGCIPTGYEILLRAAKAKGIDWDVFQDDFDLDKDGGHPRNHFGTVADEVKTKYPQVKFRREEFPKGMGKEKLRRVEKLIQHQMVLVSITQTPQGGWHSMMVVGHDDNLFKLLHHVDPADGPVIETLSKSDFVFRHDNWLGGEDIAYLENC